LLVTAMLVAGCGDKDTDPADAAPQPWGGYAPPSIEDMPWPEHEDPPTCTPFSDTFEMPEVAAPHGLIHLDVSAPLQPVGYEEWIEIEIRQIGTGDVDTAKDGDLILDVGPDATVIEQTPIIAGRATARIQFNKAGLHLLAASLPDGDGRTGTAEVMAFDTQINVWEMAIAEEDFEYIVDNPKERKKVPVTLTVGDTDYVSRVRIHGGSSRFYSKNSFRFDLGPGGGVKDDLTLPDGSDHLVLRAEWNDKTMLRNHLGMEVFRYGTWLPTPRTQLVHFRVNGRFYGAMWRVERIDGDFLEANGLSRKGSLYEADPDTEWWNPGGNLTPLNSMEAYKGTYDQKKGETDFEDFIFLIENVLQAPDEIFVGALEDAVNVHDLLVYMAAMAVIQNHEHIKKNYYMYRDPEDANPRWFTIPLTSYAGENHDDDSAGW